MGVEVLAPALHKYLLPCAPRDRASRFERMRQHVTIAPLRDRDDIAGVIVTIEDVTERFDRDRRIAADLDSADEGVRLRAAKTLAASGDAPLMLANALTDESWRVRRAAAEGMAEGGGHDVVDTLIEALREHHRNPALLNAALMALTHTRDDVLTPLLPLLEHADADVRTYSALALGLMEDSRAVEPLIARLEDADVNVRFHAIEALGRIGDRRAADAIATIAESRDFFLAFAALDALAAIGEPSVAPRLLPLLDDALLFPATVACLGAVGAEDVAVPLASLLGDDGVPLASIAVALSDIHRRIEEEIGEGALVADLACSATTREAADAMIAALPEASDDDVRGLVTVLSWLPFDVVDAALAGLLTNGDLRAFVADVIAHRGASAAPFVEEVARTGDSDARTAAAFVLGRIGSATSVPALISWLDTDAEPEVLIAVAGALGSIGDRRGFVPLLAQLDHAESTVRQAAVAAVSSIGHPQMEAAVTGRLTDPSPRVRESAARIAGYFGYASCLRRVVELCDDPHTTVRRTAVEALANYDQRPAWSKIHETAASDNDSGVRAAAVRALGQSATTESLAALTAACRDANLWVRYYAARALSRRGVAHADVLTGLAECAIRDQAVPVRIAAIEALGALRASSMLGVLTSLTRDAEPEVSTAAISALGQFDPGQTAEALLVALNGDNEDQQYAALEALGAQRAPAVVDLVKTLAVSTRSDRLRKRAVETLGEIGTPAALHALAEVGAEHRLRAFALTALAGLTEAQADLLRGQLHTAPERVRDVIVEAMGRMRHSSGARGLAMALEDVSPAIRTAAARALGRLDLREARAQLATLARTDENPGVRVAARNALARG